MALNVCTVFIVVFYWTVEKFVEGVDLMYSFDANDRIRYVVCSGVLLIRGLAKCPDKWSGHVSGVNFIISALQSTLATTFQGS